MILRQYEGETDSDIKYVVHMGNVFSVVREIHLTSGHGGRVIMKKMAKKHYANLSETVLQLFKSLCSTCAKKQKGIKKKHAVVKPILSRAFQHRAQMDLIDMQSTPDGKFQYILTYIVSIHTSSQKYL